MNHSRYLTLIMISGFVWVNADECVYKVCLCDGADILCQYRDLTSVPPLTGERTGLAHLLLDNNKITTIPAGSLPSNLQVISLLNNPVTTIDYDAFNDSAGTLDTLQFSKAVFTRIPDALCRLTALKSLTIYDTNIQDWNVDAMMNIGLTMNILFLENVGLTAWPAWIQHFANLTEISIVRSSISFLPDNALDTLAESLSSLSLIMSSLKSIPQAFSKLKNLEYLQVENNEISDLKWLPRSNRLMELSLSSNNISDGKNLSNNLRILEHSLSDLKLVKNQLPAIPDLSFLEKVGSLDFSNNRISDPTSGSLPSNLYYLDLRFNSLPSIPVIFLGLPVVKDLLLSSNSITEIKASRIPWWTVAADLGYNLITELTDTSFPENSSMTSLNLMNNPIVKMSILTFKNLLSLTTLNMQSTKLTRLPLALTSLINLSYLDVSNSDNLVCTCMEKSLEPWITRQASQVLGDCGETSVFIFFTSLSPGCPSLRIYF